MIFYIYPLIASDTGGNMLSLAEQGIWWIVGCIGWVFLKTNGGQPRRDEQR